MKIYCLFLNNELLKSFIYKESIEVYIKKYLPSNIEGLEVKVFEEVE